MKHPLYRRMLIENLIRAIIAKWPEIAKEEVKELPLAKRKMEASLASSLGVSKDAANMEKGRHFEEPHVRYQATAH